MAVSSVVVFLAVLSEVFPQECPLASRRAWATRAVASKNISSPVKAEVETGCLASDSQICAYR